MGTMASQITSLTIVSSTVYSGADQRKHQSSVSLAFVQGIHRGAVNSPHKWPVTRKMFPFDDVIMCDYLSMLGLIYVSKGGHWWGLWCSCLVQMKVNFITLDIDENTIELNVDRGCVSIRKWQQHLKCMQIVKQSAVMWKWRNMFRISCVFIAHMNLSEMKCFYAWPNFPWGMVTSYIGNIFRLTGPLCREFTGHQWIPRTKASDAELWCFLWSKAE